MTPPAPALTVDAARERYAGIAAFAVPCWRGESCALCMADCLEVEAASLALDLATALAHPSPPSGVQFAVWKATRKRRAIDAAIEECIAWA